MYKQHFIIGTLVAAADRLPIRRHEDVCAPWSILFFCECCGATYASCPVIDTRGNLSPWTSHRGLCRRCKPRFNYGFPSSVPGSIWQSWDKDFLDALPMPVLQYEFDRHFETWEKLHDHQS